MAPAPSRDPEHWDWHELRGLAVMEAKRVLISSHDAEDAAQEAVVRAFRARSRCKTPEAPQAWIQMIARREAYRLYTRRKGEPSPELQPDVPATEDTINATLERFSAQDILDQLPSAERSLLFRRYVLEQSSAEISAELGMPRATVRVQLHRATKRIRTSSSDLT